MSLNSFRKRCLNVSSTALHFFCDRSGKFAFNLLYSRQNAKKRENILPRATFPKGNEGKSEPKQKKMSKNLLCVGYAPSPSILNTLIL